MKRLVLWIMLLLALVVAITGGNALINIYREAGGNEALRRQLAAQASEAEASAAKAWVDTQTEQRSADSLLAAKQLAYLGQGVATVLLLIGGAAAINILGVGGALAAVRWTHKKAATIYPNRAGQWPILITRGNDRAGNPWMIAHDPNRGLGPSAVYQLTALAQPTANFPLPADASTMAQIATQAQAISLVAASGQGNNPNYPAAERFIGSMMRPRSADLPEIRPSQWETSHVDRLLLESGEIQ